MTSVARHLLFWTPRLLTILFILFLGLFSLDVFDEGYGILETLAALAIHLIPNFLLVAILLVAWRWEWIGAVLFSILGVAYIVMAWGKVHPSAFFAISGPLFVVGALFLIGWIKREEVRSLVV